LKDDGAGQFEWSSCCVHNAKLFPIIRLMRRDACSCSHLQSLSFQLFVPQHHTSRLSRNL
jgi:hypothetical protein